jgi:hypothetical protein
MICLIPGSFSGPVVGMSQVPFCSGRAATRCSDVVIKTGYVEASPQLPGERFASAILLPEKKCPHRAKQRTWRPFE